MKNIDKVIPKEDRADLIKACRLAYADPVADSFWREVAEAAESRRARKAAAKARMRKHHQK
jgi:hypothetical protein